MRLLRRNVLLIYGVHAVALVSGLVVTPIIVGALGTEQFGIWALIGAILGFIGLLDLGIGPSLIRFAAEQRGRGARDETSELASTAFVIYLVLALVTTLLAIVLAWLLPLVVEISDQYVRAAQIAVVLSVGSFLMRFPVGLFSYLLAGQQRYDVLNIGNLLGAVLYFGLAVVVLYVADGGLVALAVIAVVATAFRLVLPLFWLGRELPELRLSRSLVTRRQAKELLSFSSRNMLIQVASKVVVSTDVIVVGVIFGSVAAGVYGIPAKLFALAYIVGTASTTLLFPLLSELEGASDRERQERYLLSGIRLGLAVVVAVGAAARSAAGPVPRSVAAVRLRRLHRSADPRDLDDQPPVRAAGAPARAVPRRARPAQPAGGGAARDRGRQPAAFDRPRALGRALGCRGRHARHRGAVGDHRAALPAAPGVIGLAQALATAWLRPVGLGALAAIPTLLLLGRVFEIDTLVGFVGVGLCWLVLYSALVWRFAMREPERRTIGDAFGRGSAVVAESEQSLL